MSSSFGTLLVGLVTLLSSHHLILSINVNVLVSFTSKNNFVVCDASLQGLTKRSGGFETIKLYLLTNWFAYLYGRIQSPRPDVMPDRREGITRAAGFVFACINTQTS